MPDWLEIVTGIIVGLAFVRTIIVAAFRAELRFPRRPSRLPSQTDNVDRGIGDMGATPGD